jgi:hypothetical protein
MSGCIFELEWISVAVAFALYSDTFNVLILRKR